MPLSRYFSSICVWLRNRRGEEKIKRRKLREPVEVERRTNTAADPEGLLAHISQEVTGQEQRSGPKSSVRSLR